MFYCSVGSITAVVYRHGNLMEMCHIESESTESRIWLESTQNVRVRLDCYVGIELGHYCTGNNYQFLIISVLLDIVACCQFFCFLTVHQHLW